MPVDTVTSPTFPKHVKPISYLLLGKARIYQHSWGLLLAVLLVHAGSAWHAGLWAALGFSFVALQAVQYSAGAADDLGGFRDGSDALNYAGRPARTVAKKPLLTGALTESEAVRFIVACYLVSVASCLTGAIIGHVRSVLPVIVMIAVATVVLQYSVGAKLSYRPLGLEVTVFTCTAAVVLMPYWLATGKVTATALVASALFGTWFLMVVCYGNASDIAGDREVSRKTLAVLLPAAGYKAFLTALCATSLALTLTLFATSHFASPRFLWTMVPLAAAHAAQLYYAIVENDWRRARFLGILSLDLGGLGLVAAALLS